MACAVRQLGDDQVFRIVLRATVFAIAMLLPSLNAATAEPSAPTVTAASPAVPARREMTAADVESFLDGLVPLQIETNDIAGATIAIVKDGKLLFAKGYGYCDFETRAPVSPELTLFRTGSVTKLFTWTAVMQLVEQGKADLDADVNGYLDFKIPHTHGRPVTLRNLMTHRGGFQETLKNLGAQNSGRVDLGKYVRENIPDQIYVPGTTPSYSNYGASLAGYIVERITGTPFDQYVEDNIFTPLGMTQSTLRTPLPKAFEPHMSKGYVLASGGAKDFEIVNGYPAGSQSASGMAMSRFMLAFLNGGALEGKQILKPETVEIMHNTVTAYDPRQNGIALGFYEESRNGLRIIGHGGDTVYFHSDLHLVPGEKLGFFVSYNSAGRGDTPARSPLWGKFLDRYYPVESSIAEPKLTGLSAEEVAGSYLSTRRADTSLLKLLTELGQPTVTANKDGTITVDAFTALNGQARTWIPVGDGVFRDKYGQGKLVFLKGEDGVIRMVPASGGVQITQKVEPLRNAMLLLVVFGASLGIVALNFIGIPLSAFVRRHFGIDQGWTVGERLLRIATFVVSGVVMTFVIGIAVVLLTTVSSSPWALDSSLDPSLQLLQKVGLVGVAGMVFVALHVGAAWRNPVRSFIGKVKELSVFLALGGLLWFAWTMNMFDPALKF